MSRLLTRAQLGRVTWWLQTQSHHLSFPSSTIPFKQCSTTSTNDSSSNIQRKLPEHVVSLTCRSSANSGVCVVFLIGTVHISQKSCAEVQGIINSLKPEVVFVELCSSRKGLLKHLKVPTREEMMTRILKNKKKSNILGLLFNLVYAQLASELKLIPGSEFRVAYEEAIKYGGRVVLGDRPIQLKGIDCDMDMDTITLLHQEMSEMFPTLVETILHERDLYMSSTLLEEAKKSDCVVAVVGKGHLQGIKKHWEQPVLVEDLLKIPPAPKPAMSTIILTSVGVAVAGVSMIWGYLH